MTRYANICYSLAFILAALATVTPLILYARGGYSVLEVIALAVFLPAAILTSSLSRSATRSNPEVSETR